MTDIKSKLTKDFVNRISSRLSGRVDCSRVEFLVGIGCHVEDSPIKLTDNTKEVDYIYFHPDIYVYRDLHHRKDVDLFRVTDLICHKYFPELVVGRDDFGQLKVDTSKLSRGIYKYQLSVDGRKRRWIRIS